MPRLRTQVAAFTLTRTVLNTMHRMVYPLLGVYRDSLGVGLPALSLALTARSALGSLGPFLASVADSRGRKTGMLFGLLLFSGGVGLVILSPTFPAFILALLLAMLGKYTFDPSMQAYLGDRVPYQQRGKILAVTEIGWSLSFIVGVPVASFLMVRSGWTAPFPLLIILGALALVGLAWLLPKDPPPAKDRPSMWRNFRTVLTYPPALAGLSMGILLSAANEVVNLVFGIWMKDSFGLEIMALGAASAVIGLSELGGESLTAILTDRLGKPTAVGLGLGFNSLAAAALPFLGRSLPGAVAGLIFFYISFEFTLVSSIPMMTEILPAARATLMATNSAVLSLGRAVGALLASPLYEFGRTSAFLPGILASGLAAVAFNLLALLALRKLQRGIEIREYSLGDQVK